MDAPAVDGPLLAETNAVRDSVFSLPEWTGWCCPLGRLRVAGPLVAGLLTLASAAFADPGPLLPPPDSLTGPSPVRTTIPGPVGPPLPSIERPLAVPVLPPAPAPATVGAPLPVTPQRPARKVLPPVAPVPVEARPTPAGPPSGTPASFAPWEEILRGLAVSMIPENFEQTKDWGKQSRVFDGIHADVRHGNLRLAKKTALVNHGLWRRYRVTLVDPARTIRLSIQDRGEREGRQFLLISTQFEADVEARAELWSWGVKGLNGTVRGIGTLRIDVACSYAIETDLSGGLPALRLVPQIEGLNLTLVSYEARQIGLLRGDLADAVGDGSRAVLREIVNGQEEKLLKKLRAEVAEKKDRLRIAPGDWLFSKGK